MVIILEGPDGSGKTTLAKALMCHKACDAVLNIKRGGEHQLAMWKTLFGSAAIFVTDRSFISDLVYRLWDHEERDQLTLLQMCNLLIGPCKIIYCTNANSYANSIKRGEDLIVDEKSHEIIRRNYEIIMEMFEKFASVPIMRYDFANNDISEVIKFIKEE